MKHFIFSALLIFITAFDLNAQVYLNLDFENHSPDGKAKGWYQGGEGYNVFVDTTIYYSGKSSLCIQRISKGTFGVATSAFPVLDGKGKSLKFTGYIKTDSITEGYAGLWWRVDGKHSVLNFDNMSDRGAKGTSDWQKYSIEFNIDQNATNINFGVLLPGNGKAWFDNLQIELDGKVYEQIPKIPFQLSAEKLNWLKSNINTFETSDPKQNNYDLSFLKKMIGNARIVSLGEGTHGTSEFFKMKHRIVKYLAEEMGFTVFAIEANMPEAKIVNDYILYGKGDPKKALAGLYFWTWDTQEVLDMIEWMREFNKSGKGRIEFFGFDIQFPNVAVANVEDFISQYDTSYIQKTKMNYDNVVSSVSKLKKVHANISKDLIEPVLKDASEIFNHLSNKALDYQSKIDKDKVDWAIQNAKIVVQSIGNLMDPYVSRDESMADNVNWILDHSGKDAKIVLWAHNEHVSKDKEYKMGYILNRKHGSNMIVFGFGFNEGNYIASGKKGINAYSTSLSEPGSFEWILHNTGSRQFMIDLRKFPGSPFAPLLNESIDFREIGAVPMDYAFTPTIITQEFDVVIYFDKTTPSDNFMLTNK
jgi:erythromycin esterase